MRLDFGSVVVFSGGDALCPYAFRNVTYHSDAYESTTALRGSEAYMNHKVKHMGKAKIALVALCAAVLAVALTAFAGCSANTAGKIAGTYDLYEIQGSNGTTHEEIAQLEKSGFSLFINLDEDKTFHLIMVGMDNDGTWEYTDGNTITFKPNQKTLGMTNATIEDGKITMTLLGEPTVFAKGKDKKVEDYL